MVREIGREREGKRERERPDRALADNRTLQYIATHCSTLATHCNTLQHTERDLIGHCNTLQLTATH